MKQQGTPGSGEHGTGQHAGARPGGQRGVSGDRAGASNSPTDSPVDSSASPSADSPPASPANSAADDSPAPGAWESVEQLFALAPHLRPGRANVMGEADVSGDVVAGDKILHLHGEPLARLRVAGPIPARELRHLADTFAPHRRYDELCARLDDRRVLVLRGRPGTGRRSAALRMLVQAGPKDGERGEVGEVIALDPGTEPGDFAEHIRPGRAHVVVEPVTSEDSPLRDVHLNAVRRRLGDDGLFVVVTGPGTAVIDVEASDWEPPSPADVLRAHLTHAIRRSGTHPAVREAEEVSTIRRLLDLEATARYLSAGPSPREAAGFARLLVDHDAGRCEEAELSGYGRTSAEQIAGSWFGGDGVAGGDALRDKAFLISLAVFDGSPYALVADLGDRLHQRLRTVEEPERQAGHPVFGTSSADRLAWARAWEYEDESMTPWGRLPERCVAFRNGSLGSTVLRHVWTSHPAVRRPMLDWLGSLASDRRSVVRLRAAVAAGVLAAADFPYAYDEFLGRWGSSRAPMERQLAAWALYTAAEHGMETVVRRLLGTWSRRRDTAGRWTAARTYALLGGATAQSALRDIERMAVAGPAPDGALRTALEQTLDALLHGPAAVAVLERLVRWHAAGGPLRDLAAAGFLYGARRRLHEPGPGTGAGSGAAWPRLLWLADHDPGARGHVVLMWRGLLADRTSRDGAREALAGWFRAADRASSRAARMFDTAPDSMASQRPPHAVSDVESALARLLPSLVETENDRDRLSYLLRRMPGPDGAPNLTAVRLQAALAHGPAALPGSL